MQIAKFIIKHPVLILLLCGLSFLFFSFFIKDLELDISTDSLVLENDKDLEYYRAIRARYTTDDYLIILFSPEDQSIFTEDTLNTLGEIRKELLKLERVESVESILTVPLLQSPPMSFQELQEDFRTLKDSITNFSLAKKELTTSPLYEQRLVGKDGDTTTLQVTFRRNQKYLSLRKTRDELREQQLEGELSKKKRQQLHKAEEAFKDLHDKLVNRQAQDISKIRSILQRYEGDADIHLGGVPMIVTDMMSFIWSDLRIFGGGVILAMFCFLFFIFRKLRWVLLPILTALLTIATVTGILGLVGWPITVVSSNFISLLLIFTISLTVHLIVQYRELAQKDPEKEHGVLVAEMVTSKFAPCFYTIFTTFIAFGSLLTSGIRPVIDFGWMMSLGLVVAFLFSFTFFPAALSLISRAEREPSFQFTQRVADRVARGVDNQTPLILILAFLVAAVCIYGVTLLTVENRFIDYFHPSTEIHKGMQLADRKLGGTTPLDVIIDAPKDFVMPAEEDPFEDIFKEDTSQSLTETSYWFNEFMLQEVQKIHSYLDSLPETGKVLSLATGLQVIRELNNGETLDTFELGVLYQRLPKQTKDTLINPYLSEDGQQLRFAVRLKESYPNLKRDELLKKVRADLIEKFELNLSQVHLTGMAVLYNNMLQSLFRSQILTLGTVFLAVMIAFAIVFRSFKVAVVAIIPNLLSAVLVLGIMGLAKIPLDIMTITIAAIVVGIAVDDTIHYVHRYGEEITSDGDYRKAVKRSHRTIGLAMYFTTLTVMIGFSILVFSNFIPTIYFGLLTALAMLMALLADLIVLPALLQKFTPFRADSTSQ